MMIICIITPFLHWCLLSLYRKKLDVTTNDRAVTVSPSVALQISHEVLSAEMLAFCCQRCRQRGYKEERPSGPRRFFSFCLVRPAGGCAPSSSRCSKFDSKQRLGKRARLKYYPQMHTFTWTVMRSFNAGGPSGEENIRHTNPILLIPIPVCMVDNKRESSSTFTHWNPLHLVFITAWTWDVGVQKKQMFIIPASVYHSLSEQRKQ